MLDNQSKKLSKIVENSLLPKYEVVLEPFVLKKNIKHLLVNDIIDLALSELELYLLDGSALVAKVSLIKDGIHHKMVIDDNLTQDNQVDIKKSIVCSLGYVYSRSLDISHKLSTTTLDFKLLSIKQENRVVAKARFIKIKKRISLEIIEVC
jgi:hypothetical protein